MPFLNIIFLGCILAILYSGWQTFQKYGGGFAVIKLLGGFALPYSGTAIFLSQSQVANILGLLSLFPGLWLFFFT